MRLFLRVGHGLLCAAVLGVASPACYTAGNGTPPPMNSFYYPTGLTVSGGGNVLYAANSDFDLQWNGGTLQSYDLFKVRQDAAALVQANLQGASSPPPGIPFVDRWLPNCLNQPPPPDQAQMGVQLLQGCAPPVDSTQYVRDAAIIGAFASTLQLSHRAIDGSQMLYAPISGNATLTWAKVAQDTASLSPIEGSSVPFAPFSIDCPTGSARVNGRCDSAHEVGNDANSPHNSRNVTMPGEPFGLAQSEDDSALAVTAESDTKTSLLTSGFGASNSIADFPTMQFVVGNLPQGGVSIAAIPHDPYAVRRCEDVGDQPPCIRQAFLQTSRYTQEVDVLRYYDDDGTTLVGSSNRRPYLDKERTPSIDANLGGSDFRSLAFDTTQRIACQADPSNDKRLCALQYPARVYISSRTPPSLVFGTMGQINGDGSYDPDALNIQGNISLPPGPSGVALAPVVLDTPAGAQMQLRVFVALYDSSAVAIVDPNHATPIVEKIVYVGPGPYSLAFDPFCFSASCATPFSFDDVATNAIDPADTRQPASLGLRRYRFAYVGIFRHSYVQAIDLDQTVSAKQTFETVVFNLGAPQIPKGQSQ
jgi:hypothetical protein